MKKSFLKISIGILALSGLMAACYPGGPEYVSDYDVTYTYIIDENYNWDDKAKNVYFMPDTVVDVSEPGTSPSPIASQSQILANVAQEMNAYGFVREPDSAMAQNTDFIVLVSRVRTNNYYYNWWGGWGGYWGGYWGGCCYYPPVATVSNYRTASLTIQIIDTKKITIGEHEIPIIWQGVGDGLFEGSASSISTRGQASIKQMFKQSPYLNRN